MKKSKLFLLILLNLIVVAFSTYFLIEKIFFKEYNKLTFNVIQTFTEPNCSFIEVYNSESELVINKLDFKAGTYKCLIKKLKNKNKITIINSFGGSSLEAIQLIDFINNKNLSVNIREGCYSACTYLLFFANNREMCASAKIGSHQSSVSIESLHFLDIIKPEIEQMLRDKSIDLNYYNNIIENTPNDDIYIHSEDELLKYNMVDKINNC